MKMFINVSIFASLSVALSAAAAGCPGLTQTSCATLNQLEIISSKLSTIAPTATRSKPGLWEKQDDEAINQENAANATTVATQSNTTETNEQNNVKAAKIVCLKELMKKNNAKLD